MSPPLMATAIRLLREELDRTAHRTQPLQDAVTCRLCEAVFLETPRVHALRHAKRIQHERESTAWPLLEPFVFWQGMAPLTGWMPIPNNTETLALVYTKDGPTPETHHLVTGRVARWVLFNAGLLRRSGVEVARRGPVLLIPLPIWEFLCSLAVHLTFEADADGIYKKAAADRACALADSPDSAGPVAPGSGSGEALSAL